MQWEEWLYKTTKLEKEDKNKIPRYKWQKTNRSFRYGISSTISLKGLNQHGVHCNVSLSVQLTLIY